VLNLVAMEGLTMAPSRKRSFLGHREWHSMQNQLLYIADTENHALRRINLKLQVVETIAGTGEQSHNSSSRWSWWKPL